MSFVPESAQVPGELRAPSFVARPLRARDAEIDHEAYTSSPETIHIHSGGRWPVEGFTVEQDRALAAEHERDHAERRNFTFLLLDPDERRALGCCYIRPLREFLERVGAGETVGPDAGEQAAMVTFWLRDSERDTDLAERVVAALRGWLDDAWPFPLALFRINPEEAGARRALEAVGLRRRFSVLLGGPPYRYDFYGA